MMMRSWTGLRVGNRFEISSERPGVDLSPTVGAAPESRQGTRSVLFDTAGGASGLVVS